MNNVQLDITSAIAELTVKAFNIFVEDIAAMFDTTVTVNRTDVSTGTVKDLKDQYQQLAAVCSVSAEGPIDGEFHIVFDRNGVFTLPGTFTMQSEQVILENIKNGDKALASEGADTLAEIGNLMVAAWDKVFKEELEEHKQFLQTRTYIGDPWTDPQETIKLKKDEELSILTFDMMVDPLPPFKCSVLYPKSILKLPVDEPAPEEAPAEEAAAEEAPTEEAVAEDAPAEEAVAEDVPAEEPAAEDAPTEEPAAEDAPAEEPVTEEAPAEEAAAEEAPTEEPVAEDVPTEEPAAEEAPAEDQPQAEPQQEKGDEPAQEAEQPISETINKMASSPAVLPGGVAGQAEILAKMTAADVMRTDLVWAESENTVEELIAKMQQHDTAYLMIGDGKKLEGIVSKSDVRGALSPYLQSMFAKWRDSMDTATLQIKAKWVMSRPVRTVNPGATLKLVIQTMSEHGGRCMPVVDEQGEVKGSVTVFDIFYGLLNCGSEAGSAA